MNFPGVGLSGSHCPPGECRPFLPTPGTSSNNFMNPENTSPQETHKTPPPWWSNNPPTREELDDEARESLNHALEKND